MKISATFNQLLHPSNMSMLVGCTLFRAKIKHILKMRKQSEEELAEKMGFRNVDNEEQGDIPTT